MIFVYNKWDEFCKRISKLNIRSIAAEDVLKEKQQKPYIVLKHDVETDVKKALKMAKIENKYGHRGSYYVQAYLLNSSENIVMLKEIQNLNHEVSYHYDVMDSSKGNIEQAIVEFKNNKKLFEKNGFKINTVCQHGNPIVDRIGYTSNRDFFRNEKVKSIYENIFDIMVDFKEAADTEYTYYSDAGRHFQMIYDPLFNDIVDSDDKNIEYSDLEDIINNGDLGKQNCIISIHPHRWTDFAISYWIKAEIFKIIKKIAKVLVKIPLFNKIFSKYYYIAKKF